MVMGSNWHHNSWNNNNLPDMKKNDIIDKLQSLGITSSNVYPKTSFIQNGEVMIALYEREMLSDFYFYNMFDKKIYRWPFVGQKAISYLKDGYTGKYLIPLEECNIVWEDTPYIEKPDKPFKEMTLREYAAIHLKVPDSGIPWLDKLIEKVAKVTV